MRYVANFARKVDQTHTTEVLHADILFCLSTLYAEQNMPEDALIYAQKHFEDRMKQIEKKRRSTTIKHMEPMCKK